MKYIQLLQEASAWIKSIRTDKYSSTNEMLVAEKLNQDKNSLIYQQILQLIMKDSSK